MSQGDYERSQAFFLQQLASACQGDAAEVWQLVNRLVVLVYRGKNGAAICYRHDELERLLMDVDDDAIGIDRFNVTYANAMYYAWCGEYKKGDEAFSQLVKTVDDGMVDQSAVLADSAEFCDSFGKIEKSHPLYVRLFEMHKTGMDLIDEITEVENELAQQQASRKTYRELFSSMKRSSDLTQKHAACVDYEEICHMLTDGLTENMRTVAVLTVMLR